MSFKIDREIVCWSNIEGETLIVNLESGFYYTLDEVGGQIWKHLVDDCEIPVIVSALLRDYEGVDPCVVENDVASLIRELECEGLIQQ